MATTTAKENSFHPIAHTLDLGAVAQLALAATLPLAAFGAANFLGEAVGLQPHFFSPAGLPGWAGAAMHLVLLFLVGLAIGLATKQNRAVLPWGIALVIAMIAFPFPAAALDSLGLALVMAGVLLLAIATGLRVAAASSLGGWLMLPALVWIGFGAALGLAIAAAWSPPFALITAQNPPAAAP
ncbi:tryptophan-rich sensory protein [Devosia sp. Root685]|uniref:tryptophan-rich sensory protein n=1 Tax=Devosia sp. Root685 TaxID=1736587 RepID=UPI000A490ADF|nr:tryptophan-rich sensory protein [Devosia sp. Root685]